MTDPRASWLPFAAAVRAYVDGNESATLLGHDDHGDTDELPVSYLFRDSRSLPGLESAALDICRGSVVDLGAGAGCHSVILDERGFDVLPVELLPELVEVMHERGLSKAVSGDVYDLAGDTYDTVLLLMNGLGIAGTVRGLENLLSTCRSLLAPRGQILAASTDVRDPTERECDVRADGRYVGEFTLQLEFEGVRGEPFPYLYVDPELLATTAREIGLSCSVVEVDREAGYVAMLGRDS